MIKYVYSIYDASAESYSDPLVFITDAVASRSFQIECENPEGLIAKFPTDFTLLCIAQFDSVTGSVQPENKVICRGTDFVKKIKKGVKEK